MAAQRREAAASWKHGQQHEQRQCAEDEPAEDHDGRLERLDAELDEEKRRSPDGGEEQQEGGVAAGHWLRDGNRSGSAPV